MTRMRNTSMPGADKYPAWLWWVGLIVASPVLAYFLYIGEHLRGLIGTMSVGVVLFVAVPMRSDVRTTPYWLVITTCAALHILLLMSIQFEWRNFPGTIFLPLMVADALAWQWLLTRAARIANRFALPADDDGRT